MIDFNELKKPFPPEKVSFRVGNVSKDGTKATALFYIDARDVIDRLDSVCGAENWQCRYPVADQSAAAFSETQKDKWGKPLVVSKTIGKTVCEIGLRIENDWVWKSDGAGDSDIEAEKGALSDAFKRAAVRWGIGRYLYDLPSPWVEIDQFKHFTDVAQEKLLHILHGNGVKQHTLSGQAKKPAGFWGQNNLFLVPPKKYEGNDSATLSWRIEQFRAGVDKAPTRDLLAKFQEDNGIWLDKLEAAKTHELYEICSIRAAQFDQLNGGQ